MLKIRKVTVGPLMTNCYILSSERDCYIIDAGGNPEKIISEVNEGKLEIRGIIATHGHFDHILSVSELQKHFDIPLLINKNEKELINSKKYDPEYFIPGLKLDMPQKFEYWSGKKELKIGEHIITLMETPGHTPGSSIILGDGFMLTGDTLFRLSIGRSDIGGNEEDLIKSLKIILSYKEKTRIYPGHGENSDIRFEILNNVYIRNILKNGTLY